MSNNAFGKANLDSTFEGYKYFKLKTPDQKKGEERTEFVARLIPAMHSYRDSGEWKFFYGQHYGYHRNNPRNPEKPRAAPFGCIQKKNKAKEIVVECPKCTQMDRQRAKYDARVAELMKQHGIDSKDAPEFKDIKKNDQKLKAIGEWLKKHNCDKKFWMNVMTPSGEFGVLQLSYDTTMNVLIPFLKKLREEEKLDAFDPAGGVYLKFTRTGQIPRVKDSVECDTELVDYQGKKARMNKAAPLDEAQIEKAIKICPDLAKDVVKFIPKETIQQLVDCNGDPDEVDRIWPVVEKRAEAKKDEAKGATEDGEPDYGEADGDVAAAGEQKPAAETKVEAKPEAKAQEPAQDDDAAEEARLLKQMEELRAKRESKKVKPVEDKKVESKPLDADAETQKFLENFEAK